jgi:DtxR family transcriptional regulator, Mn-dependent transcriptional regulator
VDGSSGFHTVRGYELLDQRRRRLTPAMEDYVEMIYRQSLGEGYVRINALADLLNVQPPAATKMVQRLTKLELVNYKKYGILSLTKAGMELGRYLYERHAVVEAFLANLGVRENLLSETELIEHSISAFTVEKLKLFNSFAREHPGFFDDIRKDAAKQ